MAIAAFHLHQLKVEDPALKAATHRHMGNAISKYRNAIPRLNQNSIDPVWVTGVMITLLSRLRHFSSKDIYTLPVELFRMTRGLRNVMLASRQWIPSSTMMIFLRGNAMGKLEELVRNEKTAQKTRKKFSALLNGLGAGEEGSEKEEVYVTALSCIDLICEEYERNGSAESIRRQLSGTAAFIPSEFANFLENQEPLAMAILAYYFAMMKFVEGVWWLQGVPEYEIRGIESLMPRECLWAIEWPLQVINAKDPLSLDSRQWPQPSTGHIFYESAGITDLMGSFDDKLGLPSSSVNPLLGTFAIDEESDPNLWLDLDS
ncbi:hypothetical protein MMC12_003110 [Toensbergia leucococca]|nr:hypothetical protein [Toensbergia leucococca]